MKSASGPYPEDRPPPVTWFLALRRSLSLPCSSVCLRLHRARPGILITFIYFHSLGLSLSSRTAVIILWEAPFPLLKPERIKDPPRFFPPLSARYLHKDDRWSGAIYFP